MSIKLPSLPIKDEDKLKQAGLKLLRAATLNNAETMFLGSLCVRFNDFTNRVARDDDPRVRRLNQLATYFQAVDGHVLDYKFYIRDDPNAYIFPNGSVRVHSSILDLLDDYEMKFVIGHEIGHFILGHSHKNARLAYAAEAGVCLAGALDIDQFAIDDNKVDDLASRFAAAQYSQKQEYEADE